MIFECYMYIDIYPWKDIYMYMFIGILQSTIDESSNTNELLTEQLQDMHINQPTEIIEDADILTSNQLTTNNTITSINTNTTSIITTTTSTVVTPRNNNNLDNNKLHILPVSNMEKLGVQVFTPKIPAEKPTLT